jgi:hypothetical protein
LTAGLLAAAPAAAQNELLLPLPADRPLELGTAWDSDERGKVGDEGCVVFAEPDRREGGTPIWTLLTLSRAGGRLVLGVYASAIQASEGMREAHLDDASRRLANSDRTGFRDLCGDGFVAARAWGEQYVAEIEIDADDVHSADAVLETGVWSEPEPFQRAVEALIGRFGATARELPDGSRSRAVPVEPSLALRRALELPSHVSRETARPILAAVRSYPESAMAGMAIDVDPTLGWGDAARHVFLYDRLSAGTSAAFRASEMRKAIARPERAARASASREPIILSDRLPGGAETSSQPQAPESAPLPAAVSSPSEEAVPAAAAPSEGTPAARAGEPVRLERVAALVYADPEGLTVFATTHAPPGVYAERVKQRHYWVPGVAEATPQVREALARAPRAVPTRGTTVVLAEVGSTEVVMTDARPTNGVHVEQAGERHAWIAGVSEPDAAELAALAAAVAADTR